MFFHEIQVAKGSEQAPSAEALAARLSGHYELQDGFRSCVVNDDGAQWRLLSVWRSEGDFRTFADSAERRALAQDLRDLGCAELGERECASAALIEPRVEELRLIQATVIPSEIDRVMEYWRESGRELNQNAPGCVRAEAFLHREESQLHFAIWWRTAAEASHFRYTDHLDGELARGFGHGFRSFGRYSMEPVAL